MKEYCLKISSKNKKSLNNFLNFILKQFKTKFNTIQKLKIKQNQKQIFTLLKSPHVNKTAQEHFEFRTFSRKLVFNLCCVSKNFIFIKKLIDFGFHDLLIKFKFKSNKKTLDKNYVLLFYHNNFQFMQQKSFKKNSWRIGKIKRITLKQNVLINLSKFLNVLNAFFEMICQSLFFKTLNMPSRA